MNTAEAIQSLKTDIVTHLSLVSRMDEDAERRRIAEILLYRVKTDAPLFAPIVIVPR